MASVPGEGEYRICARDTVAFPRKIVAVDAQRHQRNRCAMGDQVIVPYYHLFYLACWGSRGSEKAPYAPGGCEHTPHYARVIPSSLRTSGESMVRPRGSAPAAVEGCRGGQSSRNVRLKTPHPSFLAIHMLICLCSLSLSSGASERVTVCPYPSL